jgi:hypothetical protein
VVSPGGVLLGKLGDRAVYWDELVRLEVTLQTRIAGRGDRDILTCRCFQRDLVLAARGRESHHHVKAGCGLLNCRRERRKYIPVFEFPALDVAHGAVNMQAANVLVAIGLR